MEERGLEEHQEEKEPEYQLLELKRIVDTATCRHSWSVDEPGVVPHWQCQRCGLGKYSPIEPTLTT